MFVCRSQLHVNMLFKSIISIRSKKNNVGNVGHNCTDHKSIPSGRCHWLLLFDSVHTIILALTIMINVFASSDERLKNLFLIVWILEVLSDSVMVLFSYELQLQKYFVNCDILSLLALSICGFNNVCSLKLWKTLLVRECIC